MIELYYVVYKESTGELSNWGSAPSNMIDIQAWEPGTKVLAVDSGEYRSNTHYVAGGMVVPRLTLSAQPSAPTVPADGVTEVTIPGIPVGARITVRERSLGVFARFTEETGTFEFATDEPGTYKIEIDAAFPYMDKEYTVVAL